MHEVNVVRNHEGNILDLVFFSDPNNVKLFEFEMPLSRIDEYHYPIEILISTDLIETVETVKWISMNLIFQKRGEFNGLNDYLKS